MRTHNPIALIILVSGTLFAAPSAIAQFSQQGPKLAGTGALGMADQGFSLSLSADGNTAIVGGPVDNRCAGAAWVFAVDAGVGLVEDAHATGGTISNVNSVLEPGETVLVNASWKNLISCPPRPHRHRFRLHRPRRRDLHPLDTAAGDGLSLQEPPPTASGGRAFVPPLDRDPESPARRPTGTPPSSRRSQWDR